MTSSNKKKSDKCTVGGNDRDGTLCSRKMKLESFISADATVTTGRDDLPEKMKKLLPLLGTVDANNQLVTIPSILFKNAKFVSQCHVFGTKVLLYALTACCHRHQLDFSAWPNIFQQQFYVRCMKYDATYQKTLPSILVEARGVIKPRFTFTGSTGFLGSSVILDLHGRSLITTFKNHLKENFHRVLKRDIRLLLNIHFPSISKSRKSKIGRQVFCAIVGLFDKKAPNLLKETKGEHIMQYIKNFRSILGKSPDVESEMSKLNEAMKLVNRSSQWPGVQGSARYDKAYSQVGLKKMSNVLRDSTWVVKNKENMIRTIVLFYELLRSREIDELIILKRSHTICPQAKVRLNYCQFGWKQLYYLGTELGIKYPKGLTQANSADHPFLRTLMDTLFNVDDCIKTSKSMKQKFADKFYSDGTVHTRTYHCLLLITSSSCTARWFTSY